MRRLLPWLIVPLLGGLSLFWLITKPGYVDPDTLTELPADPGQGALVFHAAGCASCHAAPRASGADKLKLAGGQRFPSDFGTFIAPNISPDPDHGIGGWSDAELMTALTKGVSPEGQHYYPAFPYTAYAKADPADLMALIAYLRSLPPVATPSTAHEVGFPFSIRRGLGLWKFLYQDLDWAVAAAPSEDIARGRYLVEALAHCGECHTPRSALGGLDTDRWMQGAPIPGSATGKTPGITAGQLGWSADEIVEYLTSGFTPDFDSAGGHMVEVIENMAQLPDTDREAIAAYLLALP